jgi:hypothetical protein
MNTVNAFRPTTDPKICISVKFLISCVKLLSVCSTVPSLYFENCKVDKGRLLITMWYTHTSASPNLYAGRFRVTNHILNILDTATRTRIHKYSPHCEVFTAQFLIAATSLWLRNTGKQFYTSNNTRMHKAVTTSSHCPSILSDVERDATRKQIHIPLIETIHTCLKTTVHDIQSLSASSLTFQHCIWITTVARTATGHVE